MPIRFRSPLRAYHRFYVGLGCRVVPEPDPELFALEPEDIDLEYHLESSGNGNELQA